MKAARIASTPRRASIGPTRAVTELAVREIARQIDARGLAATALGNVAIDEVDGCII
jgi:hypothetical protein